MMKRLSFNAILFLTVIKVFGQVSVNPGAGSYTTLADAFTAINSGIHTGSITVDIIGNTTETTSAVLNASGVGAASYSSIVISPSGGAARTITGAIVGHLIDLNGATNVTINGLNTNGNALTISNTDQGTGTSTIRFISDASNNIITNCTVLGSSGAALSTGFGVIYFATGTVTGNDNNTISNCSIGPAGANLPINGIFSAGTSTTIDNSGNSVLNNNIFNYFNTNGASNGMNINTANSAWTITGNNFYQTATRTYLTANTHNGITITTGSGYTVSNNFIGGSAANAGGTAYAMTGTIATRFIGINMAAGTTSTVNSIQNNTIANITLGTSSGATTTNGILCGINVTSGNYNIGTITGNTIGSTTGVDNIRATSTTSGGLVVGINSSSVGNISIQNNTIGSLTNSGITATIAGSITGVLISGAAATLNISNNTIGNASPNNMRGGTTGLTTGSSLVIGINMPSTATTATVNNNVIQNLSSFGTGTSGFVRGIQTATGGSATAIGWTISNNTINNLTTNSAFASIGSGLCSAQGIHHLASQGCVISQNSISNISNINTTATTNIVVAGIFSANAAVTTALGTTITRNKIWGLTNSTIGTTALTPPIVTGIGVRSGNNVTTISNNMVSLGNAQTTNTSFIGIWLQNGSTPNPTTMNVYYNSVNIEGTATTGALPSFAFLRSIYVTTAANTVTVDAKNNIFSNSRTGGTGQHFAISNCFNATTLSATGWPANATNNNVLNASAATIGHWTSAQNFAGWQTASQCDGFSTSGVALPFVNSAIADLHVNFGLTPTTLESAGVAIPGITNDYDNETRPGPSGSVNGAGFLPDLGADEFDGVYLDILKPIISYSPLLFTCNTSNRTLIATITDASGVPTSGIGLPVLYWKVNAGAYTPVTATSLGSGQYQFIFGGGVAVGDVISYYIVAQDNATTPNVGSFPLVGASGFTTNPPAVSTPPTTPSTYVISSVLPSGTYTVGAAGTYPTLTAAINEYNTRCLNGAIVFELLDAVYNEAAAMTIIKHPDGSAVNSLTIRPAAGVTSAVNATVASGAILKILGNYVTIDGSNNGTNSRDLTWSNLSTTTPSVINIGSTGTSPITNVTIKNNIVINGANTATAIVTSDGAVLGAEGYFNNITIQNNDIQRAFIGIFNIAVASAGNGNGLNITNNNLNTIGANAIRRAGIYVQGVDGATVSGNNVSNFESTLAENKIGIWAAAAVKNSSIVNNTISNIGYGGTTTGFAPTGINITANIANANLTIANNTISNMFSTQGAAGVSSNGIFLGFATSNVTISGNKIDRIKNSATAGWGSHGILLGSTSTTANVNVNNNFVSNVFSLGFAGTTVNDNGYGISINAGAGYNIYNNTVSLDSSQLSAAGFSAALFVTSGVSTAGAINLRNNIFLNSQLGGSPERYAIYSGAPNTVFASIDYNDYFILAGPNLGFIGSNQLDLAALQVGFGSNLNSLNIYPTFVSGIDLHLIPASNLTLDNKGIAIAGITTDIDSETRSTCTPDIGADEFGPSCNLVTNSNDSGAGSLRDAIGCACNGSTIIIDPSIAMITLTSPLSISGKTLTIKDADASPVMITLDSDVSSLNITSTAEATLDNLLVKDLSNAKTSPVVLNDGILTLKNTKVSGDTGSTNSPIVKNNGVGSVNVDGLSTISNQ